MWKNNLKIALRSMQKNRAYTIINVAGLAVGIAAVLLLFRMVSYELSFNKNFKHYEQIVRVVGIDQSAQGEPFYTVCTPIPAMDVMENTVSQFKHLARVRELWASLTLPNPGSDIPLKKFMVPPERTAFFAEPAFFKIFEMEWLAGDPNQVLRQPNTIVLTRSWAEKFFEHWQQALGQVLMLDNIVPVRVEGIVADLPDNCDFPTPYWVSYPTLKANAELYFYYEEWGSCSSNYQVYALLHDQATLEGANMALREIGREAYSRRSGEQTRYHVVQPLSDLHYSENYPNSGTHRVTKSRLKVLSAIGILILIMACFNFINLATAQASLRAREVGVRKTLGARRGQLARQFMSETSLIVLVAMLIGVTLASLTAPLLKYVSDVPDSLPFFEDPVVLGFLAVTTIVVTLLAGLYPAFAMASYKPAWTLRKNVHEGIFAGAGLRKSLVVLQFAIAQGLIIGAMITILQLDYIRDRDLGFSESLVYTFDFNADSASIARQPALKQRLLQIPDVEQVSFSSDQPFSGNTWNTNFRYGSRPEDEEFNITLKYGDADYLDTYGLRLLTGRWLQPSDTMREVVVNKILLDKLGIADAREVIGQHITVGQRRQLRIVGVTENFHTHNFRNEYKPLMMTTRKDRYWEAGVKIRPDNINGAKLAIQRAFDEVLPEQVFNGQFLDERIARFYEDDRRLSATTKGFGLLAIIISCLGLFGLAAHAASQRIKEIGIRKVLGATVTNIVSLLSKDFLKLVGIAILIASPLAWYFMDQWLDNFVYRIDIEWWIFVLGGLAAILIAFLTVSLQGVKAAVANPVDSLRSD